LDHPARAAIDLREAHRDRRFGVERLRALASPSSPAEDRAEDVAEPARLAAEQVLHLLRTHRPVLNTRPAARGPETAPAAPSLARLDAGRLGGRPVRPKLVVQLPLLGVRQHLVRLGAPL